MLLLLLLPHPPFSCSLTQRQIDWDKATLEFGSKSVASMKVSHANALKKIADAGGKDNGTAAPATPAKGGKRKADAGEEESGSAKKKATPKGKKGKAATVEGMLSSRVGIAGVVC